MTYTTDEAVFYKKIVMQCAFVKVYPRNTKSFKTDLPKSKIFCCGEHLLLLSQGRVWQQLQSIASQQGEQPKARSFSLETIFLVNI